MAVKRVRLVQRRKAAGYSQEKFAEHLGVERSTVVRWERAETEPQPWARPKLAAALGITADELQAVLDDVTVVVTEPSERTSYVLENSSSVDLVAVAHLHEAIRQLDERYDRTPSSALLGPAGHVHNQVRLLRKSASNPRVRKSLCEVEAESATFMGRLVWDVSQRHDHVAPILYLDEAVSAARHGHDPVPSRTRCSARASWLCMARRTHSRGWSWLTDPPRLLGHAAHRSRD